MAAALEVTHVMFKTTLKVTSSWGEKGAQIASRNRFLYFFLRVINEKCQRMVRLIWYHNQNTSAPLVYLYVFP